MGASKSAHVLMGENKSGAQGFKFPDKHLNKKPEYFYSALKVTDISSSLSIKIAKNLKHKTNKLYRFSYVNIRILLGRSGTMEIVI